MQLNVHIHGPVNVQFPELAERLDRIEALLRRSLQREVHMSQQLDALAAQVAETLGVEQSALVLIQGFGAQLQQLSDELAAAGIDNAKVEALRAQLAEGAATLAAGVAAVPTTPNP